MSPWKRNIDAPYRREKEHRLGHMETDDRLTVLEDMVTTVAAKEIARLWHTLGELDGEVRDFSFAGTLLTDHMMRAVVKMLELRNVLDVSQLESMILMLECLKQDLILEKEKLP